MLYRLFDGRNESRNVFVEFERESIVYAGNDKQEGEKIAEGAVTQHLRIPIAIRYDKRGLAKLGRGS